MQISLFTKQNILTNLENELLVAGGRMGKEIVRDFGINMYTLSYLKHNQ